MRVLACVDFSPMADDVLAQAAALVEGTSGFLVVAHAAAPAPLFVGYDAPGGPNSQEDRDLVLVDERGQLDRWVSDLRARGLLVADAELRIGPTVQTLEAIAADFDIDIVVIGRKGHNRLHNIVLGSMSEEMAKCSTRSVLLVPPTK